jgi:hypothetical protein
MFLHASLDYARLPTALESLQFQEEEGYFRLFNASRSIDIKLKQRLHFPPTYCEPTPGGGFRLGYGLPSLKDFDDEFLHITIQPNGELEAERDTHATLPFFYGHSDGKVVISNGYGAVAASLPKLTLNVASLTEVLLPHVAYRPLLWNEIYSLGEREQLTIRANGKSRVRYPPPRSWRDSHEAPSSDPKDFKQRLEAAMHRTLERYAAPGRPIGFEVSGGIDSSLLPLYFSMLYPNATWHGVTVLVPGEARLTQSAKLAAMQKYAPHAELHVLRPKEQHYPLANILSSPDAQLFFPLRDIYLEQAEAVATTLQAHGVSTVFTGNGGDEVLEHIVNADKRLGVGLDGLKERLQLQPSYYTPEFIDLVERVTPTKPDKPLSLLPLSVVGPSLHSNAYIERGIWPVSPYINVALFNYCAGLPWTLKKDKRILRAYFQARRFPAILYDESTPNETFEDYFNQALLSGAYTPYITHFASKGITVQLGYVNGSGLLETYTTMQSGQAPANHNDVLSLFMWLCTEINLYTAFYSGQWKPA